MIGNNAQQRLSTPLGQEVWRAEAAVYMIKPISKLTDGSWRNTVSPTDRRNNDENRKPEIFAQH